MRFLVGFTVLLTSVIALLIYGATSPANLTGDDFKFPAPSIIRVFFNGASSPANLTDRTYSLHYDYYCESCPSVTAPSIIRVLFSDCFIEVFDVIDAIKSEREYVSPGGLSCAELPVFLELPLFPAREAALVDGTRVYRLVTVRKFSAVPSSFLHHRLLSLSFLQVLLPEYSAREKPSFLSGAHSLGIKHCTFFENSLYNFSGTGKPDTELADACLGVVSCSALSWVLEKPAFWLKEYETLATESKSSPNLSLKGFDVIDAIKSEREYVSPGGLYCAEPPSSRCPAREAALVYILVTVRKDSAVTVRKDNAVAFKLPAPLSSLSLLLATASSKGSSKLTILVFILWFTTKTVDGKFEQYPDVPSDHPNYVFFNQFLKELRAQNAQSPINIYTGAEKTNYLSIFWAVLAASGMLGVGLFGSNFRRRSNLMTWADMPKRQENIAADTNSQIRDLREEMRAGFARVADRGDQEGFARSMLLRKPISETAELRKTFADYSLISRDLGPKILIGANDKDNFRKEKDRVGSRYRVQGAFPGLYELGHDHGRKDDVLVANLGQPESIRSRLRGNRTEEKKYDSAEEREVSSDAAEKEINSLPSILRLSPSRPQPVSERHDDIVDESDSASVCGVLLEDGTTCTTIPIKGRKRCAEHKGKKLSRVSPENHIPCEVPTARESKETEDTCGVILPDMWLFGRKQEAEVGPFSAWNITGTYKDYLSKVGISGTWKFLNSVNSSSKFQDFQKEMLGIISSQVFQESARDRLLKRKLFQYGLLFSYSDLRFSCTSAPVLNEMEKHCNIEVAAQVSRVASSENNGDKNYYRMEGLMESPGGISTSRQLQASEEPVSSPLSSPALLGSGKEDEQKLSQSSPRKVNLVAALVRGMRVKRASQTVYRVIHAALGNATHNHGLDPDRLLVVSSYTAVAKAIMVLFSPRNIIRWELEQIYETAKKEMASLERKWEEQIETTKKEIASLERKWEEQIKTCEKVDELIETCRLILEQQKKKYILISYALTEIKSMASRTGLDPQEIKEMCRNLESKQDKKSLNLSPDDNMHVEGFALSVFAKADKQDRAGRADLGTAKTFYAAAIFFETLSQFGPVPPDIEQKQKYAAWKAADIRKAIKEGRKPTPGDPVDDDNDLPIPSSVLVAPM
ncbi:unnamed protein product [Arabidopsis arenosa]|uniref:Plant heme peroxidase family profile domain-containing protein n=1 Tax=Arabidopsis arenosa TaxID=38785 RepID=A0A8S2AK68_ARAAE|nr:unnamed protein product [Arabidopsis arenosa]